jgi:hypothetical protein
MAAPAFKFTMLFNFGGSGFSESWYWTGAAPISSVGLYSGPFKALADARNFLTAKRVRMIGLRLSDLANPRKTQVWVNSGASAGGHDPDNPTNSWLVNVRGVGDVGNRSLFIRGLPDDLIVWDDPSQAFLPVGNLSTGITAYEKLLKTGNWALAVSQSKKAAGAAAQQVTLLTPNGSGGAVTLTFAGAFTGTGTLLVSGFRKPMGFLNGTYLSGSGWNVGVGNTINLLKRAISTQLASTYVGGGYVRPQVLSSVGIQSLNLMFPRERRIGRAFFVAAGRRRAR